ncbi:hypothetical protein [Bacillus salipaludis]|uniref:hypothetical protein n=1 Tax=Bacillus salipaludis TaxID=2547811 RepID=UPI002E25106D|nr:hypothetical protein [Bacillus salipaludis]
MIKFIIVVIAFIIYINLKNRQKVFEIFKIQEFLHKNANDSSKGYAIEENKSIIESINSFFDGKKDGNNIIHNDDGDDGGE